MKVALVHELLTMRGGAEKVMKIFADMFPDAPIYTLLYDEKKLGDWFPKERIRTSTIQPHAHSSKLIAQSFNHHLYLSRFPAAVESWDFFGFDLVISSSSAFAHGIITNGKPKHLCYVQSPARYLWDRTHDILDRAGHGLLGPFRRWYLERLFHRLRIWDAETSDRPDMLLTSSRAVERRIELYWRRTSTVVPPPIEDFWFEASPSPLGGGVGGEGNYALVVSTLVPYKRIELAIEACRKTRMFLKIVGEGPDMKRLRRLAGKEVEFYGHRALDELKDLYANAQVTIVPGEEDFNLVAVESMASGTPVIAYGKGGPLETIIEGKTGMFFREPTAESLAEVLRLYRKDRFKSEACSQQAKQFSRARFEGQIQSAIGEVMNT
ncbi:MAG: glycosyltransferase [Candidatus Peregrinibacteria bacterium]